MIARLPVLMAAALLVLLAPPVSAQTQYRDLEPFHPVPLEDATPVERYAFEFMLPWDYLEPAGGGGENALDLDLAYGIALNGHVGVRLPVALGPARDAGLAGVGAFALYNPVREGPAVPALALRADVMAPDGSAARGALLAIATKSFGAARAHLNLAGAAGGEPDDELPEWGAGLGVDYTFFRPGLLLVTSVNAASPGGGAPTTTTLNLGARWQWTPDLVLQAGAGRRLGSTGPDLRLTVGLSRTFGLRALVPVGAPRGPTTVHSRAEQRYYPGSYNWRFLDRYPEAGRLFNAFDYGHAILYERLTTDPEGPPSWLEEGKFAYLTGDLLVQPPRLPIAEEAIFPEYAQRYWPAALAFDWAHQLHRQVYDVLSDDRLSPAARDSLVERLTDYYLTRRDLAFAPLPKSMALMTGQPYSGAFARAYPKFNGLIWAYHWLQVGLYEPLVTEESSAARRAGIDASVARFRAMIPDGFPATMPMTPAVAPTFSARHPRAAAIFDNLHSLHDIISDILLSDVVPPEKKRAAIEAALAEFRDATRNVVPVEEWLGPAAHHVHGN